MSMADKRRKLLAGRGQEAPGKPPHLARAPIMVLAAAEEPPTEEVFSQLPSGNHPQEAGTDPGEAPSPVTDLVHPQVEPEERPISSPRPRVPAEQMGVFMNRVMQGLQSKGASRRTLRLRIPYSIRPDRTLFAVLKSEEGSAASRVLEAFRTVPKDNPDAIAGAAEMVSERRRRPGRQGLGQSGTVTVTLDGAESETLEVLAKRARISCGAYLEGCLYIWAVGTGRLDPEI